MWGSLEPAAEATRANVSARLAKDSASVRFVRGSVGRLQRPCDGPVDVVPPRYSGGSADRAASRVPTMDAVGDVGPSVHELRWRPPVLVADYVPGVDRPGRAEQDIITALRARHPDSVTAPRIGVCGIGGSGKTMACAGVAGSEWVRAHLPKGTVWVQLDAPLSLQTLSEAAMALVHRFCGGTTAQRLAALSDDEVVVAEAARYISSATMADAAKWLVVFDDVPDTSQVLLQQLLKVIPSATPVLFSTRSEAVVTSVFGVKPMRFDELPEEDARQVLRAAESGSKEILVPRSLCQMNLSAPQVHASLSEKDAAMERCVLDKTKRHALSLSIVGSMIGNYLGMWRPVVTALEQRWMELGPGRSDDGALRPSMRAVLDVSVDFLSSVFVRDAFAALGVLPARVCLPALTHLWRSPLGGSAVAAGPSTGTGGGVTTRHVEDLAITLKRAGLVRLEVNFTTGHLVALTVHPVVGEYALSLLGDAASATHRQMVDSYMGKMGPVSRDAHGWRRVPFWEVPDDGYWYDNVVRHVAAAGDVCGLISVMDPEWQATRVRESSSLAFQSDVELVLTTLTAVLRDAAPSVSRSPVLLGRAHAALASAYRARIAGSRLANMEAAVKHLETALALAPRTDAPAS